MARANAARATARARSRRGFAWRSILSVRRRLIRARAWVRYTLPLFVVSFIAIVAVVAFQQIAAEREKAILTVGRRDISFDVHLPTPQLWARPGQGKPQPLPEGHMVTGLNDQHCHLAVPASSPLAVGDLVSLGISHPCTTFDKWQVLCLVDDDYTVVDAIKTFF